MHHLDRQKKIIFTVWDGDITWEEWQGRATELLADPDWQNMGRVLVDLRTVTNTTSIGDQGIERAFRLFLEHRSALARKRGAAIARDEFANASKFEALLSSAGIPLVVFNTLDTACTFLGVDLHYATQTLESVRTQLRAKNLRE